MRYIPIGAPGSPCCDPVLKRFERADFPAYADWFVEADLARFVGTMDHAWLEAILSDGSTRQFSVLCGGALAAVTGVHMPDADHDYHYLTDIAVRQDLRRAGLATWLLRQLLGHPDFQTTSHWQAAVRPDNISIQSLFQKTGWSRIARREPDDNLLVYGCSVLPL